MSKTIDMFGVGNALLDVEYRVSDAFLEKHQIEKRRMTLVDEERLLHLINALDDEDTVFTCGGSVANTLYAMSGFGKRTHLTCRVAPDDAGHHFVSQLANAGVASNHILPVKSGLTGQCLVLVTEDAERTMNTYLGVSELLMPSQVDEAALKSSKALYLEGYLASSLTGSKAAVLARELADDGQLETNLTLADTSMVNAFRSELSSMIGQGIKRLFCNFDEAMAWCRTDRLDVALTELADCAQEVVITLGPDGCAVRNPAGQFEEKAYKTHAIDMNGAGDMFAAAFLAWCDSSNYAQSRAAAQFANFAAAKLIRVTGARLPSVGDYTAIHQSFNPDLRKAVAS